MTKYAMFVVFESSKVQLGVLYCIFENCVIRQRILIYEYVFVRGHRILRKYAHICFQMAQNCEKL